MLRVIIQKEIKDCIYGYRSLLVFILSTILFLAVVYTGVRQYQASLEEFQLAQSAQRQMLSEETNIYSFGLYGINVVKAPQPLSVLVEGIEPLVPRVFVISLYQLPDPRGSSAAETPTASVFGTLDLTFIVQVVLGLAALLFTFSSICGEKESGTLKIQLANSVPRDLFLLGKLMGNLLGLLAPVALAFLLGCVMLVSFEGISLNGSEVARTLLLAVDSFLYLTVLFTLGLAVSSLTSKPTSAFTLCLVAWAGLVAVLPKTATVAAKWIMPLEPLQQVEMERAAVQRHASVEAQEEYSRYLQQNHRRPPLDIYLKINRTARDKQNRELQQLEDDYSQRQQRQARLGLILSRFSPAGSASYAAMALSGTDLERDIRFRQALRDYRASFTRYYDQKGEELIATTNNQETGVSLVKLNFTSLPVFNFEEEPLASSLNRALPDMALLLGWSALFFGVAYFAFLRYDVR